MTTFFESKEHHYFLEKMTLERTREIGADLTEKLTRVSKINENIPVILFDGPSSATDYDLKTNKTYKNFIAWRILSGRLLLQTELLYLSHEGRLMAAQVTTDGFDNLLPQPISLFDLASFQVKDDGRLFTIHPLHQIGVDPQFLYDFGQKYGRKLD